jgi:hypothetical protein
MARWSGGTFVPDAGSITDQFIATSAAIDADKMQHCYKPGTAFGFVIGGTPTTREELVFIASSAGTIRGFHCLLAIDGSSTSITFDLKKNGSSILTAVVTVTDSTGNGVVSDGTLSSSTIAADDRLSISMTVSSSTGAQGPFAWIDIEENSAPS